MQKIYLTMVAITIFISGIALTKHYYENNYKMTENDINEMCKSFGLVRNDKAKTDDIGDICKQPNERR